MGVNKEIPVALKHYGYKAKTVSITHLPEIQDAVGKLIREGLIAKQLSDSWHFYRTPNTALPEAKSIIIVALPQSITRLTFFWQGREYLGELAPGYFRAADDVQTEKTLRNILHEAGYKIAGARLPLKTTAVCSGLAKYGKNNLAYVPGMGSFLRLIAFYTDAPCEEDNWKAPSAMKTCADCALCRQACPNGNITADRFLIYAENCLGFIQEKKPEVPHWVMQQPWWLNAFIGCMRCQTVCPLNKPYLKNIKTGPFFSEAETAMILDKKLWEQLSPEIQQKLEAIRGIYPLFACNLPALIEKQRQT
jgi:epoxyqueuosine reductase